MTLTIRNDEEITQIVQTFVAQENISKSDFVRKCIKYYAEHHQATPWELGEDVFGRYASSDGQRSTNRKQLIRDKLSDKHSR